ncbi:DUF2515 family protein [Gorillibacterium sp. sgz500922]|uniref:DUF2515 family protein n=1 Tax=Gorillibacterium sp. sgz500922 TaxID=3446694 RepID=UPI003F67BDC7
MNPFGPLRRRLSALLRLPRAEGRPDRRPPDAAPSRPRSDGGKPTREPLPVTLTAKTAERIQDRLRSALQTAQSLRFDARARRDGRDVFQESESLAMEVSAELADPSADPDDGALEPPSPVEAPAPPYASEWSLPASGDADLAILAWIRQETARMNRNNLTRTFAYHRLYTRHPELHWAFLAHMVSRNAGWNMTDLKGGLLPRLLGWRQIDALYQMLERANALIFQDAYPQLLLYQEGKRRGRRLTPLLSRLDISSFMPPLWDDFAETGDPVPLTVGLIVNEQNFIQGRVIENPFFAKEVLEQPFFRLDSLLHVNQTLFPYVAPDTGKVRLAGMALEDFPNLEERIRFGRKLYALLFGVTAVQKGSRQFADAVPHTGSRSDYWPEVFTPDKETPPSREETKASGKPARYYSPPLASVWPNRPVEPAVPADWFRDMSALAHFSALKAPASWMMDREHLVVLKAQEAAAAAKTWAAPSKL